MSNSINKSVSKSIYLIIISAFFICSATTIISKKVNFSGIWILNLQKSEFEKAPVHTALKQMNVDQEESSITIEAFNIKESGETISSKATYTFDGKNLEKIMSDKRKMKANIQWTEDLQTIKKSSSYSFINNQEEEEYNAVETWNLSDSGKTLIVNRTVAYKTGFSFSIKAVYNKR